MTSAAATYVRERYHRLKREGRCVKCSGVMLPEWRSGGVMCPQCKEDRAAYEERSGQGAKKRAREAGRMRERYRQDPVKAAAAQRTRRMAKKQRGECIRCIHPAAEDSNYCETHRDSERARIRDQARRRRERRRNEQQARAV